MIPLFGMCKKLKDVFVMLILNLSLNDNDRFIWYYGYTVKIGYFIIKWLYVNENLFGIDNYASI